MHFKWEKLRWEVRFSKTHSIYSIAFYSENKYVCPSCLVLKALLWSDDDSGKVGWLIVVILLFPLGKVKVDNPW